MIRSGLKSRQAGGENGQPGADLVAVAVEAGKSSQHALKWAADHILSRGQTFVLLHVRPRITSIPTPTGHHLPISEVREEVGSAFLQQMDHQTSELLLPFQCFCRRRGLNCKEVIVGDSQIPKAIVNFVIQHSVDKLVMGASSRNAFTRTFKHEDVPTSVSKIIPDFCSIYVISKGKLSSAQPATRPKINKLVQEFEIAGKQFQSVKSETVARHHIELPGRSPFMHSPRTEFGSAIDSSYQSIVSCPSPSRTSIDYQSSYIPRAFLDGKGQQSHLLRVSNEHICEEHRNTFEFNRNSGNNWSRDNIYGDSEHSPPISTEVPGPSSMEDMESVMRRMKLKLKLAVDMHDDASKEVQYEIVDEEAASEAAWSASERKPEMAEKERHKFRALTTQKEVGPTKAVRRENILLQGVAENFSLDARYRRYTIDEIQKATNNFSDSLKIGEGAYGSVFKSTLDHTPVAIKIPRSNIPERMKQFQQEVEVLSCVRHPNMVLLMGACPEYGCLVYEYMANGSLEERLFCLPKNSPLSWQLRFKIAAEIATGLLFLHQTKPEPLVHRDLKPANILLDENFVSKIADVGLARLVPSVTNSSQYMASAAAGTFCYIDPEYQMTGEVDTRSDIYALGVILLQLITAKPPMGLTHQVERSMEMGRLKEMLDPMVLDWPMEQTVKLARLGLMCAELQRSDRPDLASIVLPELIQLKSLAESAMQSKGCHLR